MDKLTDNIISCYQNGLSMPQIAKRYRCGRRLVEYRLRKYDIPRRTWSEALKGRPKSIKHRKLLSKWARTRIGKLNPNWKGGIEDAWSELKSSPQYKRWRTMVFKRDNYTCQDCGSNTGRNLSAHHLLPRRDYPQLTFCTSNGRTLCKDCHKPTFYKEYDYLISVGFDKKTVNCWKAKRLISSQAIAVMLRKVQRLGVETVFGR